MGLLGILSIFITEDVLVLLVAFAGLLIMLGMKKLAKAILAFAAMCLVVPFVITAMINSAPLWVVWVLTAYLVFLIPFMVISALGALTSPALGQKGSSEMVGHLSSDLVKAFLRAPFILLLGIYRMVMFLVRRVL